MRPALLGFLLLSQQSTQCVDNGRPRRVAGRIRIQPAAHHSLHIRHKDGVRGRTLDKEGDTPAFSAQTGQLRQLGYRAAREFRLHFVGEGAT